MNHWVACHCLLSLGQATTTEAAATAFRGQIAVRADQASRLSNRSLRPGADAGKTFTDAARHAAPRNRGSGILFPFVNIGDTILVRIYGFLSFCDAVLAVPRAQHHRGHQGRDQ